MNEELYHQLRADLACANDFFDYATGEYVDSAIFNLISQEKAFEAMLREIQKEKEELKKSAPSQIPQSLWKKIYTHYISKRRMEQW